MLALPGGDTAYGAVLGLKLFETREEMPSQVVGCLFPAADLVHEGGEVAAEPFCHRVVLPQRVLEIRGEQLTGLGGVGLRAPDARRGALDDVGQVATADVAGDTGEGRGQRPTPGDLDHHWSQCRRGEQRQHCGRRCLAKFSRLLRDQPRHFLTRSAPHHTPRISLARGKEPRS